MARPQCDTPLVLFCFFFLSISINSFNGVYAYQCFLLKRLYGNSLWLGWPLNVCVCSSVSSFRLSSVWQLKNTKCQQQTPPAQYTLQRTAELYITHKHHTHHRRRASCRMDDVWTEKTLVFFSFYSCPLVNPLWLTMH